MTHEVLLTLTGDMYRLQKGLTWIIVDQFLFSPSSITFFFEYTRSLPAS